MTYFLSCFRLIRIASNIRLDYNSKINDYQHIFRFCRKAMNKPNISKMTTSIWSAISFKKDVHGHILQFKQRSYSLPVIDEKETKQNISALAKALLTKYTVRDISILLMECLDEIKFQYMLSHNGFRLAKSGSKHKRVMVSDIYAFSKALTYCFSFLPPETPVKPLTIVSGVMAPAGQDLGATLLKQFWQTQGHTIFNLGSKIKPRAWLDAIEKYQPNFLGISCMLNTCIANLRELLDLLSAKNVRTQVCVGGMAINKLMILQLIQEYHVPLFYGMDFIGIPKSSKPSIQNQNRGKNIINLPEDTTALSPQGNIFCCRIPLTKVIIADRNRQGREFISNFNCAVIVTTSSKPPTKRDEKTLTRQLLKIEKFIEETDHLAFAFHYPIPCPFCLPADCRKKEGTCMNPAYMRPSANTFHINLLKTMENAGIPDFGLSTLILVK